MDYRGGIGGQKRARGDASHGEGDWTCTECGNVNFSFRTTCNLRKCGAPKPAHAAPHRVGQPSYQQAHEPVPPPMYMGGGATAPSSMPPGLGSNYGMPMGPLSSAAGVPFDYNSTLNVPSSYNNVPSSYNNLPLQSSYAPASGLMGGGLGYGAGSGLGYAGGSVMDGAYGMNLSMARATTMPGPGSGMYNMEENGARKRRGGLAEVKANGDWMCPKCGNSNYSFRVVCNMKKCNTPKPADQASQMQTKPTITESTVPDGSWTCDQCGNINYPFRTKCNRRSCGAERPVKLIQQVNNLSKSSPSLGE